MLSVDFVTKPQSASMFDMFGFFLDLLTVVYLYKVSEKFYSQGIKIDLYDFRKAGA